MKIKAIRLKEVGRFSAPVALEGLSGDLDVLVGPNEFGKSTIINAVRTVLFEQHRSRHRKLEALRPYSGGAPMIEVDFEAQGNSWRLRKQFLSAPAAELRDLRSNSVMRGADAEARLTQLVGDNGPFGLLYVEQGASLAPIAPKADGGAPLLTAIERELANLADGQATRFVAEKVREQLATLVTARQGRPTGVYKAALDKLNELEEMRARARDRLLLAQQRLEQLEQERARLSDLTSGAATEQREQAAAAAKRALDEAREARRKGDAAAAVIKSAQQRCGAAEQLVKAFDKQIDDLSQLERDLDAGEEQLAELRQAAALEAAAAAEQHKACTAIRAELARLERASRAGELADRLQHIETQLSAAHEAEAVRAFALSELEAYTADDVVLAAARGEAAEIATIEARLTAAAPSVSVAYIDGAAGKVSIDGRALADGEVLHPSRPLTLTIAGIGTLTIVPGQSSDVAADEAVLADRRRKLTAHLARAGAADIAQAEQLLAARRAIEARLQQASMELRAAAPQGREALERTRAQLRSQLAALGSYDDAAFDELERRGEELATQLRLVEARLTEAQERSRRASEAVVALKTRMDRNAELASKLAADLGDVQQRELAGATRRIELGEAKAALETAVIEGDVWRSRTPSNERLQELESVATVTARAVSEAAKEIAELREAIHRLEGALESDRDADVEAVLKELDDRHAAAAANCKDLEEEVAALLLLAGEIDTAEARNRDRFVAPVAQRLGPYLQRVIPQAQLLLGADLTPDGLERGSVREEFSRLSGGTREQLALLVRLALARILADAGTSAPFILDDALVFADDHRVDRMFAALREASEYHQVLVLTCHEQTFTALGGNRIGLSTWADERVAA